MTSLECFYKVSTLTFFICFTRISAKMAARVEKYVGKDFKYCSSNNLQNLYGFLEAKNATIGHLLACEGPQVDGRKRFTLLKQFF